MDSGAGYNFTLISGATKYLVVIAGPTAVGKTNLAIQLALQFNTVILSADSRQFYRGMTIGTAKPDASQLAAVKHYFIDTKDSSELYGAGHYEKDVMNLLGELYQTHNLVIMTGGSGLYIDAVLNGVDEFEEIPVEIREDLNKQYAAKGIAWLQEEIKRLDPEYAVKVDIQNPQRIIRALEVCMHTGKPFSSYRERAKHERPFTAIGIFLNMEREKLYARINQRVDEMMESGLLEEVKQLLPFKHFNALKTVGYKELIEYLEGGSELSEAVNKIKQHTRNYAKRQLTWFKNKAGFEEFNPSEIDKIKAYLDIIISHG